MNLKKFLPCCPKQKIKKEISVVLDSIDITEETMLAYKKKHAAMLTAENQVVDAFFMVGEYCKFNVKYFLDFVNNMSGNYLVYDLMEDRGG